MLKLLSNQYKNTAMLKRGKKPLTIEDREKIELEQQFMAGQKFFQITNKNNENVDVSSPDA